MMNQFADKIEAGADELATLEGEDNGKMYGDAFGDAMFSAILLRYHAGLAMNHQGKAWHRDNYGHY